VLFLLALGFFFSVSCAVDKRPMQNISTTSLPTAETAHTKLSEFSRAHFDALPEVKSTLQIRQINSDIAAHHQAFPMVYSLFPRRPISRKLISFRVLSDKPRLHFLFYDEEIDGLLVLYTYDGLLLRWLGRSALLPDMSSKTDRSVWSTP